jgi:hypothetical protein
MIELALGHNSNWDDSFLDSLAHHCSYYWHLRS